MKPAKISKIAAALGIVKNKKDFTSIIKGIHNILS